jgi:hypothetical protein
MFAVKEVLSLCLGRKEMEFTFHAFVLSAAIVCACPTSLFC